MVKIHNNKISITNNTSFALTYHKDWFDSGRLGDGFKWPSVIHHTKKETVLCYESNWSMAGCSGFVQFKLAGAVLTIGFSNPSVGSNKAGVGITGKQVWTEMTSNEYQPQNFEFPMETFLLRCTCLCTGGETNVIEVVLENANTRAWDGHHSPPPFGNQPPPPFGNQPPPPFGNQPYPPPPIYR